LLFVVVIFLSSVAVVGFFFFRFLLFPMIGFENHGQQQ